MQPTKFKKSDFFYHLPENLIAQTPIEPRDCSRLLVYDRKLDKIEHKIFKDVIGYLKKGDVLVINNTKVLPARIFATTENGGVVEVLLLKRLDKDVWEVLVKPGKKCKIGKRLVVGDKLSLVVEGITDSGERIVRFYYDGVFEQILDEVGSMPLPPYIKEKLRDKNRYQTVYAKTEGSAAAPTAGLHFTPDLLGKIRDKGVAIAPVMLHVGLGTFRPVKADQITEHVMHSEFFSVSEESARIINERKAAGGRLICVGTTSCRTIESVAREDGTIPAMSGDTGIFIYPGYRFKAVDALITNFHLPESTLLMLVSAFYDREHMMQAYKTAVEEQYRFFSFGDAMFIQ